MSAILSFLGGSVFRMLFGALMGYFEKKQEHVFEVERMKLQADLEDRAAERRAAALTQQAELKVEAIRVQGDMDIQTTELQGWSAAVATATARSGIWIVDLWNGIIRPSAASIALYLWVAALYAQSWQMTDWDKELVGVILGFFFASRMMQQRGQ